jgi:hypothetical protein
MIYFVEEKMAVFKRKVSRKIERYRCESCGRKTLGIYKTRVVCFDCINKLKNGYKMKNLERMKVWK